MHKIKTTIFLLLIFLSFPVEAFFLCNKSPFDLIVEFWSPINAKNEYTKNDFLMLPASRMTDIVPYEDFRYPPFSNYMLKFVCFDKERKIVGATSRVLVKDINDNTFLVLLAEPLEIRSLKATPQMNEAAKKHIALLPLTAVPFFWGGAKIQNSYFKS
jgi:hypothetical protein